MNFLAVDGPRCSVQGHLDEAASVDIVAGERAADSRSQTAETVFLMCQSVHTRSALQLLLVHRYPHEHPQELFVGVQSVQPLTLKVSDPPPPSSQPPEVGREIAGRFFRHSARGDLSVDNAPTTHFGAQYRCREYAREMNSRDCFSTVKEC